MVVATHQWDASSGFLRRTGYSLSSVLSSVSQTVVRDPVPVHQKLKRKHFCIFHVAVNELVISGYVSSNFKGI